MKNIMKVNNAGGICIERYDTQGNIESVFSGLEYGQMDNLINDLVGYGLSWDYDCAGGNCNGYYCNGNINGDLKMINHGDGLASYDGELTASDVIDNHESTKVVASWDGETLTIDQRGFTYFGIDHD